MRLVPGFDAPAETPEAWNPVSDAQQATLEAEVGFAYESVSVVAEIVGGAGSAILVVTSADLSVAVEQVLEHPYWGSRAASTVVNGWTVLEFGDDADVSERSALRPIGQGGSLGYGPEGIVLWSDRASGVRAAIEAEPLGMSTSYKQQLEDKDWRFVFREPPYDPLGDDSLIEEVAEIYRVEYAPENTLDVHQAISFVRGPDSSLVVVLIEHQTESQAAANASRFPDLLARSMSIGNDGMLLSEVVATQDLERFETVVSITLAESRPGVVLDERFLDPPFAMTLGQPA